MNGYYPNYPRYYPNLAITRVTLLVGFEASSIVGMKLSAFLRRNTLTPMTSKPTVFIPFKLMRRNPIKIRSCAIVVGLTSLTGYLITLRWINVLNFEWLSRGYATFSLNKDATVISHYYLFLTANLQ